jgi:general secretion pathway protein K
VSLVAIKAPPCEAFAAKPRRATFSPRRGSALLAVLWLTAALSAIAFGVASTVRGETERVATSEDDVRATYLAQGAIERAILYLQWAPGAAAPDGGNPYFVAGQPQIVMRFPSGVATVDIIPEASKLDVNHAAPEALASLMLNLGATPDQAATIAAAILDWRTSSASQAPTAFDELYLAQPSSFLSPHASFQEIEELLFVQGMTADLFYGTWVRQATEAGSRLLPRGGVRDCISVYGSADRFDANWVDPAVLAAVGASPDEIQAVVDRRRAAPFVSAQDLADFTQPSPDLANHLMLSAHTLYTLRATVRLIRPDGSLSEMKRVMSALVKIKDQETQQQFRILRWYDRG